MLTCLTFSSHCFKVSQKVGTFAPSNQIMNNMDKKESKIAKDKLGNVIGLGDEVIVSCTTDPSDEEEHLEIGYVHVIDWSWTMEKGMKAATKKYPNKAVLHLLVGKRNECLVRIFSDRVILHKHRDTEKDVEDAIDRELSAIAGTPSIARELFSKTLIEKLHYVADYYNASTSKTGHLECEGLRSDTRSWSDYQLEILDDIIKMTETPIKFVDDSMNEEVE